MRIIPATLAVLLIPALRMMGEAPLQNPLPTPPGSITNAAASASNPVANLPKLPDLSAAAAAAAGLPPGSVGAPSTIAPPQFKPLADPFSQDADFLDDLEHRAFQYFWDTANPETGLVPDRARADGTLSGTVSSIAADGFELTAVCIGAQRGWIDRDAAYQRVLTTLQTFDTKLVNEHGFFYHYVNMNTGERVWNSEASSIDTWLFLSGALTVRQYFPGTPAAALATKLYEQADWAWMTDGGDTLTMGWKPGTGFLKYRWNGFSEDLGMYLMAIGSRTHPLDPHAWNAFDRASATAHFMDQEYMQYPPLFIHQYPQAWIDFRGSRDAYANYWENSRTATMAQKAFCEKLQARFPDYGKVWGITASDGQKGYMDWGGPPINPKDLPDPRIDGTVVPCAAAGSIPFAPEECIADLRRMYRDYGATIYRKYGFVDAFNPATGWHSADVVGIDLGITLVMSENYRTGLVWRTFMTNPEIPWAMKAVGFAQAAPEAVAAAN